MSMELIKFYADWCGPCRAFAPTVDKLAKEHDLVLTSINIQDQPDEAERYDVRGIPTLVLMKDGEEVARHTGANTLARTTAALGLS